MPPFPPSGGIQGTAPSGILDGPPPNPMLAGPQQLPFQLGSGGSRQLPPEVLQGLMSTSNTISQTLDSMASMVPDLASDIAFIQDGIKRFLSKVLLAGGQAPTSAQAGTPMPNGIPPSPSPSM